MKLLRYGGVGAEKPGILDGQGIIRGIWRELGGLHV